MKGQGVAIEIDEIVKVLVSLGIDETTAREQLALAEDRVALAEEVAALAVESEAGVLLPLDTELDIALFELVDGLRQAGVPIALGQTRSAAALVLAGATPAVFEARFSDGASARALAAAVSGIVPSTHQVLEAVGYDAGDAMALVILDRGSLAWLRAAFGSDDIDRALAPLVGGSGVVFCEGRSDWLLLPDFAQRFHAHAADVGDGPALEDVWRRVSKQDARIPWPDGQARPPGDDLYELTSAIAREPLSRALGSGSPAQLADVLYRFALVTSVGAHWDLLAARFNPGMSAQGLLGMGQLTWAWFIFDAMGAEAEATAVARLLDHPWVRNQERATVSARQRAWYDLAALLRGQTRPPAVGRVRELLPLLERDGWRDASVISAALALHTEPRGDQLTHQPICYVWPAPLYALARRARATDLLPSHDPFLSRPVHVELVNKQHELVAWAQLQLARFVAMDATALPALLDPLPVIVDVRITELDGVDAHGRTLLAGTDEAEHRVAAAIGGKDMKVGEVWLLEVTSSRKSHVRRRYDDLGEVACQVALPTGEWLRKAEDP